MKKCLASDAFGKWSKVGRRGDSLKGKSENRVYENKKEKNERKRK